MALVRSDVLGWVRALAAGNSIVVVTAPAGHRYLLKSVSVARHTGAGATSWDWVYIPAGNPSGRIADGALTVTGNSALILPGWMLEEGDALQLANTGAAPTLNALVSGIDFTLP